MKRHADLYRLSPAALATVQVERVHDTGRGGIIVTFRQRVDGIEVHRNELDVLLKRDLSLVAISGNLHPSAVSGYSRDASAKLSPEQAIAVALHDLFGARIAEGQVVDTKRTKGDYRYFDLSEAAVSTTGLRLSRPARVKEVYFPLPDRLQAAYFLEVVGDAGSGSEPAAYAYVIAAGDGRLLYRQNLTLKAFDYRVWAKESSEPTPLAGPHADFMPHPTGSPDGSTPSFTAPVLINTNGFNTNPDGTFDPWLSLTATTTSGNNVDAYADLNSPDGYSAGDVRATITSPRTFDRTYDVNADPRVNQDQIMASVTQLFFVNNFLHDWYYDSGFDEASGNAQNDNYGRGGLGGDALLAEAQDYSGTDNANMQTFAEGDSPIMQMYVWRSSGGSASLSVQPLNASLPNEVAEFSLSTFDINAPLVLVNDGAGTLTDACTALVNAAQVAGNVALIDRGNCTFTSKAIAARNAGAVAVLIANNEQGGPPMAMSGDASVNIPVVSVSQANGAALKSALQAGQVTVNLSRQGSPTRDGTIDNSIVAHEWGHYLHHRLVACGATQCGAQSEGWGDFVALHMLLDEQHDVSGAFPLAVYATAALEDAYFGIRRAPYSHNFGFNGLTFRHIANGEPLPSNHPILNFGSNASVHNAGEVWTSMLFDAYVGLLQAHPFAEAKRRMGDYIVAGMKLAPVEPTFTEQRDAILAAAAANDTTDLVALARGFARRGAGTCAVSPSKGSSNLNGVVEDYDIRPNFSIHAITLDDGIESCDNDGILDRNETGRVTVEILNTGVAELTDARVDLSTIHPGVRFPSGSTAQFATVPPFSSAVATVEIALDSTVVAPEDVLLDVTLTSAETCAPQRSQSLLRKVHYDVVANSSRTDDVESEDVSWTPEGSVDAVWYRERQEGASNHHWRGIDFGAISDTSLVSPDLIVSSDQPFVIAFKHAFKFEFSESTAWDGAVIELSTDGGATWSDLGQYTDPGYPGRITDLSGNPLANRRGFVDESPAWPQYNDMRFDLGTTLAGRTVQVRFRIGTDQAVGDEGWQIDDIAFSGITNSPFPTIVEDGGSCGPSGEPGTGGSGPGDPLVVNPDGCGCSVIGSDTGSDPKPYLLSLAAALGLALRTRRQRRS
ncbi:M36 family metallopeptidase [Chondromyces crocatus]|uniref:M36 family metallopeptidase n=1 Tax=Chondromyces crocatus TaxID=52 RepID=UPI0014706ED7|nr:M36 family metallopeptidase [Chondromyces crocatus]